MKIENKEYLSVMKGIKKGNQGIRELEDQWNR